MVSLSAHRILRPCQHDAWDALADIEVFIFATEAELKAMDVERVGVHRRGRRSDPELRRRVLGLIWMLTFGGMQWSIASLAINAQPLEKVKRAASAVGECGNGYFLHPRACLQRRLKQGLTSMHQALQKSKCGNAA
jgi:hypothetical protein